MSEFDVRIGKARLKSTAKQVKITYKRETITLSKRKLKKLFIKAAATAICVFCLGRAVDATVERVDYLFDVISVRVEESKQAEQFLLDNNLNTEPTDSNYWYNDYSDINGLSAEELYGLLRYCGRTETDKILRQCGYNGGWKTYLVHGGFYDEQGQPSIRVWENYMEKELVDAKREVLQNGRGY